MRNNILCINSDAVNRYGFLIPAGSLEKVLKEMYSAGMPYLLGHDVHLPVGWIVPFGIYLEPGFTRTMAISSNVANTAMSVKPPRRPPRRGRRRAGV